MSQNTFKYSKKKDTVYWYFWIKTKDVKQVNILYEKILADFQNYNLENMFTYVCKI